MKPYLTIKKTYVGIIFAVMIWLLAGGMANAHKITVFAWAEGDTIHVESKFSGGKKVKGGEVIVSDLQGNPLLTGKTNEQGEFSFETPKTSPLKIAVVAGMGHRGEWTLSAEDMPVEQVKTPETEPERLANVISAIPVAEPEKLAKIISASDMGPEDIQQIVEDALDKKLRPLMKLLAESQQDHGPSLTDILGGLGYILGLMGIAAYFNFRRGTNSEKAKVEN